MPVMNCVYMYFLSPSAHPNTLDTTIRDSNLMTSIGHRMLYHDNTTTATEALLVPSPLYVLIVYVIDAMGHVTTLIAHQTCRLIMTYTKGFR